MILMIIIYLFTILFIYIYYIIYFELIWTDNDLYKNLTELDQKDIKYRFTSSIYQSEKNLFQKCYVFDFNHYVI